MRLFKIPDLNQKGGAAAAVIWTSLAVVIFVVLPFFVFGTIVAPNEIGVRQNYYSMGVLKKGFGETGLKPGLHWKIPGLATIITLPRDFQFIHFNSDRQGGELSRSQLDIPTTDGSKVKTDITLVVRLHDAPFEWNDSTPHTPFANLEEDAVPMVIYHKRSHGGPKDLVNTFTADPQTQLLTFSRKAENELKKQLSRLSTTNYYNPALRERFALMAKEAVNNDVAKSGIQLWAALIRRYTYAEQQIDDQIFAKNLQVATERLNQAESSLKLAQAETERQSSFWDAKIKNLLVEGKSKVEVVLSEASLYEASKKADGDLLVAKATAEVDRSKAQALTTVKGAEVYIAREMAPLLKTLSGGVVSNIDPYDLRAWIDKFTK